MNTYKASNVSLIDFRKFLVKMGAKQIRSSGGHLVYSHPKVNRPIIIQSHINPIPQFIVLEIINYLEVSSEEMWKIIKKTKGTTERKASTARRGKRAKKK
jgi:predicted RNA binding protein YcfA (HicA-like mRNA interferase family)